jgi:hypothetical protein
MNLTTAAAEVEDTHPEAEAGKRHQVVEGNHSQVEEQTYFQVVEVELQEIPYQEQIQGAHPMMEERQKTETLSNQEPSLGEVAPKTQVQLVDRQLVELVWPMVHFVSKISIKIEVIPMELLVRQPVEVVARVDFRYERRVDRRRLHLRRRLRP